MICGEKWRRTYRLYWRPHRTPRIRLMLQICSVRRSPLARLALIGTLVALCCGAHGVRAADAAPESGVLRATLDNGLRVVIVRNSLAPVVATSVNYLAGS